MASSPFPCPSVEKPVGSAGAIYCANLDEINNFYVSLFDFSMPFRTL